MAKIILDCDLMKHPYSGLYYYCLNLANSAQKILDADNKGLAINYYVPANEKAAFNRPENCIIENPGLHKFFRPFMWDCTIWHAPFQSGRMFPRKDKKRNLKIVLTIHDLNALHEGQPKEVQERSLAHTQKLINQSDAIVCISEFAKNDVLAHCDVGSKPIYAIHNGIHNVHIDDTSMRAVKPQRPFLFGIGYVNTKKNYHVLLPLLRQNPDLELVVAGKLDDPNYIESMRQTASEWGIADRFHLTGPVSDAEKAWYMSNCLAFMHPSLAEGFGLPVVEAMQFGKPLFLSNKTSLPEIGGDVAFYFHDFNPDHMQHLFQNGLKQYEAGNLKEKILQRGKDFSWEISARKYVDVYYSLL